MKSVIHITAMICCVLACSCKPEVPSHPCEEVTCMNGGNCFNGTCMCPDEYEGESCEIPRVPEAMFVTGISFTGYPTFRGNDPWDGPIDAPACWPDFAVTIQWPWGQINQSFKIGNAEGGTLFWGPSSFVYIADNHVHGEDVLEFSIHELDGLDSLEAVSPPELMFSGAFSMTDVVLTDSLNPWPDVVLFESDSSYMSVSLSLRYEFDH